VTWRRLKATLADLGMSHVLVVGPDTAFQVCVAIQLHPHFSSVHFIIFSATTTTIIIIIIITIIIIIIIIIIINTTTAILPSGSFPG
jgi:hypothetical protein